MSKKILSVISLALLLFSSPWGASAGHDKGHFVVSVDDGGFNGRTDGFTIEVEQGQLTEVTFIWEHKGYVNEEHVMVLEGYKLEWDKLDINHRQATLKFIADKSGTFTFKCDLKCDLHDYLQNGSLKVKSGTGGSAARTPTKLTIDSSASTTRDQPISLMVALKDDKGAPIPKAEVRFFVDAEFVGIKGQMEIGVARTDANGVAFLDYRPTLDTPQQFITAQFEGMGVYAESKQVIEIQEAGPPSPAYRVAPVGLDDIRRFAPGALVALVASVWVIYAFVLSQVLGILRLRGRR